MLHALCLLGGTKPDWRQVVVRVKLSGDGAKFSRCSSFFLLSLSLLNLQQRVLSPLFILFSIDNHTIEVINMPEKYDFLATALDPLLSEIKELMALKMVQVDRKSYESEFYLGGDLKVMSQHY